MYIDLVSHEYIRTEKFIHDELLRRAERAIYYCELVWKKDGHIPDFFLIWPTDTVTTDEGFKYSGVISGALPPLGEQRKEFYRNAIKRTNPYALLIVEQHGHEKITAVFETNHGAYAWEYPIRQHGDVYVLGPLKRQETDQGVGVLRRPLSTGHA